MKCDFCGFEFNDKSGRTGCSGCPMSKACNKIKCPNCNYEMIPVHDIKVLDKFKKWGKMLWKKKVRQKV